MVYKLLLRHFSIPNAIYAPTKEWGSWAWAMDGPCYKTRVRLVMVSLGMPFFRQNGTSIAGCIRDVINDLFDVNVQRVRDGLTCVWTPCHWDITSNALLASETVSRGRYNEGESLIAIADWVKSQSQETQRRLQYDGKRRHCILPGDHSSSDEVLRSPRARKCSHRRAFRM